MRTLVKLYAKIRELLEPVTFKLFKEDVEIPKLWDEVKKLSPQDFQNKILSYPYRPDRMGGLLDNTLQCPDYFFADLKHNRDCDDFARMWSWYLKENGGEDITEIIYYGEGIKQSHVFTVAKIQGMYYIFDYKMYISKESSVENAVHEYIGDKWIVYKRY